MTGLKQNTKTHFILFMKTENYNISFDAIKIMTNNSQTKL